jgi:negative regulator of genetic competence, sporulation and motility
MVTDNLLHEVIMNDPTYGTAKDFFKTIKKDKPTTKKRARKQQVSLLASFTIEVNTSTSFLVNYTKIVVSRISNNTKKVQLYRNYT